MATESGILSTVRYHWVGTLVSRPFLFHHAKAVSRPTVYISSSASRAHLVSQSSTVGAESNTRRISASIVDIKLYSWRPDGTDLGVKHHVQTRHGAWNSTCFTTSSPLSHSLARAPLPRGGY
jgi:hypothetical protein